MGNRSYLTIVTPNGAEVLFEGNNSLAIFWLTLLQENDIRKVKSAYEEIYNEEDTEDNNLDTDFVINISEAVENGKSRIPFFEANYPKVALYFKEWLNYISNQKSDDDCLHINLFEISYFYDNIDEFIDDLVQIIKEIDNNTYENDFSHISETSGWAGNDDEDEDYSIEGESEITNAESTKKDKHSYKMLYFGCYTLLAILALINTSFVYSMEKSTSKTIFSWVSYTFILALVMYLLYRVDNLKKKDQ